MRPVPEHPRHARGVATDVLAVVCVGHVAAQEAVVPSVHPLRDLAVLLGHQERERLVRAGKAVIPLTVLGAIALDVGHVAFAATRLVAAFEVLERRKHRCQLELGGAVERRGDADVVARSARRRLVVERTAHGANVQARIQRGLVALEASEIRGIRYRSRKTEAADHHEPIGTVACGMLLGVEVVADLARDPLALGDGLGSESRLWRYRERHHRIVAVVAVADSCGTQLALDLRQQHQVEPVHAREAVARHLPTHGGLAMAGLARTTIPKHCRDLGCDRWWHHG